MNVGELIRLLSHWCPDTTISVLNLDDGRELDISALVTGEEADDCGPIDAEIVLTARF